MAGNSEFCVKNPEFGAAKFEAFWSAGAAVVSFISSRDVEVGLGDLVPPLDLLGTSVDEVASAEGWVFGLLGVDWRFEIWLPEV